MRILELEKLFETEDQLDKVLVELDPDFKKVDYWANLMKDNVTNNPEEAKKALNELTGAFSNLRTALSIAETEKKNREIRYYNKLRIEHDSKNGKFVSTTADKEASAKVAFYRRIKNIILGYKEACEKAVLSLQSLLKYMIVEYNTPGQ